MILQEYLSGSSQKGDEFLPLGFMGVLSKMLLSSHHPMCSSSLFSEVGPKTFGTCYPKGLRREPRKSSSGDKTEEMGLGPLSLPCPCVGTDVNAVLIFAAPLAFYYETKSNNLLMLSLECLASSGTSWSYLEFIFILEIFTAFRNFT